LNYEIILLKNGINVEKEAAIEPISDVVVKISFHEVSGCQFCLASLNQISLPNS
jgi:hypothetical protein